MKTFAVFFLLNVVLFQSKPERKAYLIVTDEDGYNIEIDRDARQVQGKHYSQVQNNL